MESKHFPAGKNHSDNLVKLFMWTQSVRQSVSMTCPRQRAHYGKSKFLKNSILRTPRTMSYPLGKTERKLSVFKRIWAICCGYCELWFVLDRTEKKKKKSKIKYPFWILIKINPLERHLRWAKGCFFFPLVSYSSRNRTTSRIIESFSDCSVPGLVDQKLHFSVFGGQGKLWHISFLHFLISLLKLVVSLLLEDIQRVWAHNYNFSLSWLAQANWQLKYVLGLTYKVVSYPFC
jgi:hypothetical protein